MNTKKINGKNYALPEGFKFVGREAEDENGVRYELYYSGYQAKNDIPYVQSDVRHGFKRVPLVLLDKVEESPVNKGLAWELSLKLTKMLMDGGELIEGHVDKMRIMENEFDKFGDVALKDYVLPRVKYVVETYKRTGVWDLASLGK